MKIALLAPSGVGKTVYLAGLYGRLVRDLSYSDYGIDFTVSDTALSSYLDTRYTNLVESGDFGEGSKEMIVFPWTLSTEGMDGKRKKLEIEIIDFPGGFLHRATDENRKDVEATVAKLADCDGFIVLVDGDGLIKGIEKKDPRILQNSTRAAEIQKVLAEALERRSQRVKEKLPDPDSYAFSSGLTPVVFALTKGDLVEDWLSKKPDDKKEALNKGVKAQFKNSSAYLGNEGEISNFMRSQFSRVIDNPNVASLRMTVTVYNEAEKALDPKNLDTALQFVLFTGLHNALAEYGRREAAWKDEKDSRGSYHSRKNRAYDEAVSARVAQRNKFWLDRVGDWLDGVGGAYHDAQVASAHEDLSGASSYYNSGAESHKRAKESHRVARFFYERILPASLVHRLSAKTGRDGFYHQGFPIDALSEQAWWQRKIQEGTPGNDTCKPGV